MEHPRRGEQHTPKQLVGNTGRRDRSQDLRASTLERATSRLQQGLVVNRTYMDLSQDWRGSHTRKDLSHDWRGTIPGVPISGPPARTGGSFRQEGSHLGLARDHPRGSNQ